ncbi:MAG TPA: hypothetical protein PK056_06805 [Methylotenera sp.]|nr:hypothetical protein [Methylotenera sp.]
MSFQFLISGFDTIECAYYLIPTDDFKLDFIELAAQKESMIRAKTTKPKPIQLGSEEFLISSHGTSSGYPFVIENDAFMIQFGEFNRPNFFVKYRSIALWHYGALALHERFLAWAASVGMMQSQPERLSRVDYAFDYHLPVLDFDENNFLSQSTKDSQYRKDGILQTLKFGTDNVVLRIYNKVDEIIEKSQKTWFFKLWGMDKDVWRVEWQVRKDQLRKLGIASFTDLNERQGDLLRLLVNEHTTLRIKTNDSNKSRWPLHPLWLDLIERVNQMEGLGVVRDLNKLDLLDERLTYIGISVYGYVKRVAAIDALYTGAEKSYMDEAFTHLQNIITEIHDPLTWQQDVNRRAKEMSLGEW